MSRHNFSWKEGKNRQIMKEILIARTLAKSQQPEFKTAHPDWVRDAATKNYAQMDKKVKEDIEKFQALAIKRRQKLIGQ